jgi:TonB family protein
VRSKAVSSHLFSVLVSSRPERDLKGLSPILATVVTAHAIVLTAAIWITNTYTPTDVLPADRVAFARGEPDTDIILITPETSGKVYKAPRRGPPKQSSGRLLGTPVPAVADLANESAIALAADSAPVEKNALDQPDFAYTWATPSSSPSSGSETSAADTADLASAPRFTAYTIAPVLKNEQEIRDLLHRQFPPALLRDGGDVRTIVWLLIDVGGQVLKALVLKGSGRADADAIALASTQYMLFEPAEQGGKKVPVWVQLPIRFRVEEMGFGR